VQRQRVVRSDEDFGNLRTAWGTRQFALHLTSACGSSARNTDILPGRGITGASCSGATSTYSPPAAARDLQGAQPVVPDGATTRSTYPDRPTRANVDPSRMRKVASFTLRLLPGANASSTARNRCSLNRNRSSPVSLAKGQRLPDGTTNRSPRSTAQLDPDRDPRCPRTPGRPTSRLTPRGRHNARASGGTRADCWQQFAPVVDWCIAQPRGLASMVAGYLGLQ